MLKFALSQEIKLLITVNKPTKNLNCNIKRMFSVAKMIQA